MGLWDDVHEFQFVARYLGTLISNNCFKIRLSIVTFPEEILCGM